MITYKPIVIQGGRRKDGTWPVKIRVTFKGAVRRLPTTLVCTDSDLTRTGHIKSGAVLQRAGELIAQMRGCCDGLSPFVLDSWTVDDVVAHIRGTLTAQTFRLDFFAFADEYLVCKIPQTRRAYTMALGALERFLGRRSLDVNEITRTMLLDYRDFVDAEPWMHWTSKGLKPSSHPKKVQGGASGAYLMKLAHIYNAAKFRYNDEDSGRILIPRSPFDGLHKAYPPGQGSRALKVDEIQRLIDWEPETWVDRVARAAFLLSFATMGANLADLYEAKAVDGEGWKYNRKKTRKRRADGAEVRVLLSEVLTPLLRDLGGQSGGVWWLPELHRWKGDNIATNEINKALRRWIAQEGLEDFTFGGARHSWGTIARNVAKVEKATVDEALAHVGDFRVTDMYVERSWDLAWEANEKVLALFRWPCLQDPED